jgi:hypothetical protein
MCQVRSDGVEEGPASKPVNVRFTEGTKAPSRLKVSRSHTHTDAAQTGREAFGVA